MLCMQIQGGSEIAWRLLVAGSIRRMRTLPQGTVTFLFSDVEGSTKLSQALGDVAWAGLLETHRLLMRQAFAAHDGLEVDTQGDAFFAVFTRASDAVAAAPKGRR